MNRRGFLKRYGLLPFVGSLSIVGQTEASCTEDMPKIPFNEDLLNALVECYNEMGRPVGPLAQLRNALTNTQKFQRKYEKERVANLYG